MLFVSKMVKKFDSSGEGIVMHGKNPDIIGSVEQHAQDPGKKAFVFQEEDGKTKAMTYVRLKEETSRLANLLNRLGVKKSSRVFIFLPKIKENYISFLGTIKHGSIPVPLFEAFQSEGIILRLGRGDANVLITNKELSKRIPKNIRKEVPSLKHILIVDSKDYRKKIKGCPSNFKTALKKKEDTAIMIFTSSTAGTPVAGIEIPHGAIVQQYETAKLVLDLKEEDRYWCTAHPGWVTGSVYGILAPLVIGCTNYVYEGHFDSKKWIGFMRKNAINVIYTAPTALRMLRQDITKKDLKEVRVMASVGEALTSTLFNHYKKLGVEIDDTYWQTETGAMVIANWPSLRKKVGSIGKPLPGITASIIDGTIALRPDFPSLMSGIYKHDKMYKSYFKNGWFMTNDLARKDSEGYFFFNARKDDIIKTSGERVSPIEIESILLKHRSVKESGVIGIPDKMKGSIIKAFIVLNDPSEKSEGLKEELKMFVKKNYAGHAYPKEIEFVDSLPKTESGKIIRMKLRELSR
jgi:acetyl-CoA synthetase